MRREGVAKKFTDWLTVELVFRERKKWVGVMDWFRQRQAH
jgi:hypothetical protein